MLYTRDVKCNSRGGTETWSYIYDNIWVQAKKDQDGRIFKTTLIQVRSSTAHNLMLQSADEDSSTRSTGENRTHHTPRLWPLSTPSSVNPSADHSWNINMCPV